MNTSPIYLDHAATTAMDESVLAAMQPYFITDFYNPSANYTAAKKVHVALDQARGRIAYWLGARPAEITFTAGATEANNIAIQGIMERFPDSNIVVSAIEHESVLLPARRYDCREVAVDKMGSIVLDDLANKIDDRTVLVSIMYANNEIGSVQPIREVSRYIATINAQRVSQGNATPLYFHSDAAQAGNYLDLHTARLGVDLLSINGSKIYGPKQSGILYVKGGVVLRPVILGGGQEHNLRSGTENVAGCIGLAAALDLVQQGRRDEVTRLQSLQHHFFEGLAAFPEAQINGSQHKRLPSNIHVTFMGQDNERLLIGLDELGIMAAAGSACSASSQEPSHVLKALGLSDELAQASLRFSMGRATTEADVDRTLEALQRLMPNRA
jgi:cysteine desulfurase